MVPICQIVNKYRLKGDRDQKTIPVPIAGKSLTRAVYQNHSTSPGEINPSVLRLFCTKRLLNKKKTNSQAVRPPPSALLARLQTGMTDDASKVTPTSLPPTLFCSGVLQRGSSSAPGGDFSVRNFSWPHAHILMCVCVCDFASFIMRRQWRFLPPWTDFNFDHVQRVKPRRLQRKTAGQIMF